MGFRASSRAVAIILVLLCTSAVILRVAFFSAFLQHGKRAWIYVDSDQYNQVAYSLKEGKGYADETGAPQAYRLPGLSTYLAFFYTFFCSSHVLPLIVQCIMSGMLPLLVYGLMTSLWPGLITQSLIAAAITAVHPGFILYSGMIATEPLSTLFLVLWLICFLCGLKYYSPAGFLAAGCALGVLSLFRPVGHYLLLVSLLFYLAYRWCLPSNKKHTPILGYFIVWVLIVAPWLVRNWQVYGVPFFHSLPGLHFIQYTAAHTLVAARGGSYPNIRMNLIKKWKEDQQQLAFTQGAECTEYQACVLGEKYALSVICKYPLSAMRYTFVQLLKTVTSPYSVQLLVADREQWQDHEPGTSEFTKLKKLLFPSLQHSWLVYMIWWDVLLQFFLMIGVCMALITFLKGLWWQQYLLLGTVIGLFVGLTAAYGCARLRHPIEPLLIIVAVSGWWFTMGRKK